MCRQMVHGWPLWNLDDIWNNNIINCEASQAALGPLVELLPSLPELCKYNNEVILYSTETQLCWAITVGDGGGARERKIFFTFKKKASTSEIPFNLSIETLFGFSLFKFIYANGNAERGNCKGTTWWMLPSLPSLSLPAVASSQKYKFKQNRN